MSVDTKAPTLARLAERLERNEDAQRRMDIR